LLSICYACPKFNCVAARKVRWVGVPHIVAKEQSFNNKDRKPPHKLCPQGTAVCSGSMVRFCGEKHEHLGFITKRHLLNRCVKVRIAKQNLKPTRNYINLRHPQCVSANKLFILLKWLLSYLVQVPFINYVQNCYMFRLNTGFNSIHLLKKQVNQQCQCQKMAYGRTSIDKLDCVLNVMAHAHKPDFVFRRNGRVHLNRRGLQFSRLLAAEVCVSAVVMLDIPCSKVV